jgi:hypothetical protein
MNKTGSLFGAWDIRSIVESKISDFSKYLPEFIRRRICTPIFAILNCQTLYKLTWLLSAQVAYSPGLMLCTSKCNTCIKMGLINYSDSTLSTAAVQNIYDDGTSLWVISACSSLAASLRLARICFM